MTNQENSMYELMLIFIPDLGEDSMSKELTEIRDLLGELKGEIVHEDIWGVRDLSYIIKKREQGYYTVFNFSIEPKKIKTLEESLVLNQKVLRHLVIKTPKGYEVKTLAEYLDEAEKDKAEADKKKAEELEKKNKPAPKRKPVLKEEDKSEKEITPKREEIKKSEDEKADEIEKAKRTKKEEKTKLEEVDEKLKNIINDPDISL